LIGRADAPSPARLTLKITCASADPAVRLQQEAAPVTNARNLQFPFNIPSSACDAQWLTLEISQGSSETEPAEAWVDQVRISGA
jgi:hypothetical protein